METTKIVGDGWKLWVEDGRGGWEFEGAPWEIYDMVSSEFPAERLVEEYDGRHIVTWGTRFGPLWEDVLEFLTKWGVKAEGVDVPEFAGEQGPFDETNPE